MKLTVSEIAKLTSVSVRTLHYYDEIGLLQPSIVSETGYRYYDELALERLQQILFYRELDFSLKEIHEMMSASGYQKEDALKRQRELLLLKQERLRKLLCLLDANMKGDNTMSFEEFDMSAIEEAKVKYAEEVKQRWGDSDAFKQSKKRTDAYSKEEWKKVMKRSDDIMKKFAEVREAAPESEEVQKLVDEWKTFITESYYDCTNEILAGLGCMYREDERFKNNIDKFGQGTAEIMSKGIEVYCGK